MKELNKVESGCVCGGLMIEIGMSESTKLEHMKTFERLLLAIYHKSVEQCLSGEISSRTSSRAEHTFSTLAQLESCVTTQVKNRMELAFQFCLQ